MSFHERKAQDRALHRSRADLERCRRDLWFLETEYLGRGWNPKAGGGDGDAPFPGKGLTEGLHKPICRWLDARRNRLGVAIFLPRFHHKTELAIGSSVQDVLIDPNTYNGYFHGVDALASQVVSEAGYHMQHNKKLRSLDPVGIDAEGKPFNIFPATNRKKFITDDQYTIKRNVFSRFPTLFGKGIGSEVTGFHMRKAWLDDIIGRKTIADSALPKVADWFQSTLMPVVDDGIVRVSGTRWDQDACYEDWIKSVDWCVIVLPCAVDEEFDFIEDPERVDWSQDKIIIPAGKDMSRPIYGPLEYREVQTRKLVWFQKNMGADFAPQMENNPTPPGEIPWDRTLCEHEISFKDAMAGDGTVFVLSDPAPSKIGGLSAIGEKVRADGSKDRWALAVIRIKRNGARQELILLTGKSSKDWDRDAGFDQACALLKHFKTPHFANEHYGGLQADYQKDIHNAARRNGVPLNLIEFNESRDSASKNQRWGALCSRAKRGEFLICTEKCDPEFLELFLGGARKWRPMGIKNGLKHDDEPDVVSRATNAALAEYAPSGGYEEESEVYDAGDDSYRERVRHIA